MTCLMENDDVWFWKDKTKFEDTRRGRIDLCKKYYEYFMQLKPYADRKQQTTIRQCEKAMKDIGIL